MDREPWRAWAVGLVFGSVVGLPVASFGPPQLMLSVGLVALAFLAARSLAFLSGAVTGIGGIWAALLIRAQLACDALDAAPNQSCQSSGVEPWAILSLTVFGTGLLLGCLVWRRRGERNGQDGSLSR